MYYDHTKKWVKKSVPVDAIPQQYAEELDRKICVTGAQHVQSKRKFKDLLGEYIDDLDEDLLRQKTNARYGKKHR